MRRFSIRISKCTPVPRCGSASSHVCCASFAERASPQESGQRVYSDGKPERPRTLTEVRGVFVEAGKLLLDQM